MPLASYPERLRGFFCNEVTIMSNFNPETLAVHAGHTPDELTGSRAVPIFQTTAYQFRDTEHAANLFDLKEAGYIYTRLNNPTVAVLEDRITQLEGGVGAVATSAGHFAEFMVITSLAEAGDEIVTTNKLYGGTNNLFFNTFKKFGITFVSADQNDPSSFERAITDKTKAIYLESISNPLNEIADFEAITAIAKKHKVPVIVDNTYPTPYLFRPKEIGADIVVHSLTKFLGGHGNSVGGIAVDLGTFDWAGSGRFPGFTEPDPSYHGVKYAETFGNQALAVKMRVQILRDIGGCLSPFNAFLQLQGIETLHLRMERHTENALKLAEYLEAHDKVDWVCYPGLKGDKNYDKAQKYFKKGVGAMISFGVKGDLDAGKRVINSLELATHLVNLGDTKTLVAHPASTTHRQLSKEQQEEAGITDSLIRISVGIESIDDIIKDFENALKNV
jgi:O-acetylhomoserine (thiol)-lyase